MEREREEENETNRQTDRETGWFMWQPIYPHSTGDNVVGDRSLGDRQCPPAFRYGL